MRPTPHLFLGWMVLGLLLASTAWADTPPPPAAAVEFFESKVRPILADHCFSCHGPKKQMGGGVRVDSRAALLKGGDTGPIIVPGSPDQSPMIRVLRHDGDIKMPPKSKLSAEAIDTLTAWIKLGAPWPESKDGPATVAPGAIAEAARKHWAFQPVRRPQLPAVRNVAWIQSPVDRFILAGLEEKQLAPAPPADRRTLVRRVTFDLTGLPPTMEEMEDALADPAPNWFAKVVERLLTSPHYGERWGRHWLDVARYADTKGYLFLEERRFPYSYTYRDYVIRAFNEDLPYDQFILQQLAADQLPRGGDPRSLAAMGYLTLGRRFLNNVHDIIDDRIDVVSRGLLGLTTTCARCHDHKFDPIPTRDYYSLYSVFANSTEPKDLPLIGDVQLTEGYRSYLKELQTREHAVRAFADKHYADLLQRLRSQVGDYLVAASRTEKLPGEDQYEALNPGDLIPELTRRWRTFLGETGKRHPPIFTPWHAFAALPKEDFAVRAKPLAERFAANADAAQRLNANVAQLFADKPPQTLADVARAYGELFKAIDKAWADESAAGPPPLAWLDPEREMLRQVLYSPAGPVHVTQADVESKRLFDRDTRSKLGVLLRKVDEWKANTQFAPPRAMVLNDVPAPRPTRVLVRGNPNNLGDTVPRQFLAILAGDQRKPFSQGSGRLELAQAIASKDNPLTARVMVNRIWLHHFGGGLVRTPSDFGLRGEPPTHPQLLDYLAASFVDNGWSIKQVHRLIVLSNTYQQGSAADARLATLDPENRWLARVNRRRLDFEQLRDALLFAAGRLDPKAEGPSVELTTAPFTRRRTVYGFIERQNLPGIFRTFDFASPDASTPQRYTTTVPQQALFLLNSPFVVEQAKHLAARAEASAKDPSDRVARMYRVCYGRAPDAEELALGVRFVQEADRSTANGKALAAWEKLAQVLLLSNEFAFVD